MLILKKLIGNIWLDAKIYIETYINISTTDMIFI